MSEDLKIVCGDVGPNMVIFKTGFKELRTLLYSVRAFMRAFMRAYQLIKDSQYILT